MIVRNLTISLLLGFIILGASSLAASAQYANPASSGDQIYVNQPSAVDGPGKIVAPSSLAQGVGKETAANFAQQPYSYADPYLAGGACAPAAAPCAASCGAPLATPGVAASVAPLTSGFTYSTQQASAFGPFTPPVSQASEQFYQYPGITPYGAYPGAGYAATGGMGFDPASGYYGPYGAYTPL